MGVTPALALPYPEGADPPRGDTQIRALAEAVEAALGKLPRVWSASKTAAQTGIGTTVVDVSGLSVTFPAVVGRVYRAAVFLPGVVGASATNRIVVELTTGANARLTRGWVETRQAGTSADVSLTIGYLSAANLSGSQTWKVRAAVDGFGSSMTIVGAATNPALLVVDELWPVP